MPLALALVLPARGALAADHLTSEILAGGAVAVVMLGLGALLVWQLRARWALNLTADTMAALPRPCQIVDGEGRVVLANPAFHEVFGGEAQPIPALLAELVSTDEEARDKVRRLAANARGGVGGYLELAVPARKSAAANPPSRRAGPELQWLHVTANPLPVRAGAVYWAVEDITDRRQMEQVIQGEQERFYDLIDHAPIGFYSVDGQGRFLFVNQTLADWLGLPQEQLVSDATLHQMLAEPPPAGTPAHHPFAEPKAARGTVTLRGADGRKFDAEVRQELVTGEEGRVMRTRSV
ncbi:MAG: PAS domain-containing protein, partial [Burkholderiales bacterium]